MAAITVKVVKVKEAWKGDAGIIFNADLSTLKDGEVKSIPWPLQWWGNDAFADLIKEGAEISVEVEAKPNKRDETKTDHWAKVVNGIGKKGGRGGTGGGSRPFTPKTPVEIHAPNIAAIIAAAHDLKNEDIKDLLQIYRSECANYQTATNGRQGAS